MHIEPELKPVVLYNVSVQTLILLYFDLFYDK